jgi:hypothetical protein
MPGGKIRLKVLATGGLSVGSASTDTFMKNILAGSVSLTSPAFTGNTAGSQATVEVSITGLTASHVLQAFPRGTFSPCIALVSTCPGAGVASMIFAYIAGSGGAAAAGATTVIQYLAVKT